MNPKKARALWLEAQEQKAVKSVRKAKTPAKTRKSRPKRANREDALYEYARLVYKTDRDYDVEFS